MILSNVFVLFHQQFDSVPDLVFLLHNRALINATGFFFTLEASESGSV